MTLLKQYGSIKAVNYTTTKHGIEVVIGAILVQGEVVYKTEGFCSEIVNTRVLKEYNELFNV